MFTTKANFANLATEVEYRTNPLAAKSNPLLNPAAPIGLSDAKAAAISKVTNAGLQSQPDSFPVLTQIIQNASPIY